MTYEEAIKKIEILRPGDACEVYTSLRICYGGANCICVDDPKWRWALGTVVENGGGFTWKIFLEKERRVVHPYLEYVRLPGQTEAWLR